MALTGREMRPCWPRKVAVCNRSPNIISAALTTYEKLFHCLLNQLIVLYGERITNYL